MKKLTVEEARAIIQQSTRDVIDAAIAGFEAALRFLESLRDLPNLPGWMVVRYTAEAELLDSLR